MKRVFISDIRQWPGQGVLSLVGATGSGKTKLALEWVSRNFPQNYKEALLVSVDSVAVYKELNIGTAKPCAEERDSFRWAGLDLYSIKEELTAADFVSQVLPAIEQALDAKQAVILVGGSHFYERALVEGMGPGRASDERYQQSLNEFSDQQLWQKLIALEPRLREKIHVADRFRVSRYLDLIEQQRLSYEQLFSNTESMRLWESTYTLRLGLGKDREQIWASLKTRVRQMLEAGLVEEVRDLLRQGYAADLKALQSVGYKEVLSYLRGEISSREELTEKIYIAHRQLAKKQRTWLRRMDKK